MSAAGENFSGLGPVYVDFKGGNDDIGDRAGCCQNTPTKKYLHLRSQPRCSEGMVFFRGIILIQKKEDILKKGHIQKKRGH